MEQQEYTATELKQIFKDKLANAEDSYQHYTMVDKDPFLASYAKEDLLVAKSVLKLIENLEKSNTNDRDYWEEDLKHMRELNEAKNRSWNY